LKKRGTRIHPIKKYPPNHSLVVKEKKKGIKPRLSGRNGMGKEVIRRSCTLVRKGRLVVDFV